MTSQLPQPRDIRDIFVFLNALRSAKIWFHLTSTRDDSITVRFTLVGCRVELDFFDDHIEFSYFTGSEGVELDWQIMEQLISEHWSTD